MSKWLAYLLMAVGLHLAGAGLFVWYSGRSAQQDAQRAWAEQAGQNQPQSGNPGMMRLYFPRLAEEQFVFEGATEKQLLAGPGRITTTALPGRPGNCIIAGHRDTHFRFLRNIRKGDEIQVEQGGNRYLYRVTGIHIVEPSNRRLLKPEKDSVLTLVTCYPFFYVGPAPKRFIVRAELNGTLLAQHRYASQP